MKNICILCNWEVDIYENMFYEGCGGSETWVIQISKEFANRGYYVDIYTINKSISINHNIRYLDFNSLEQYLKVIHYDYAIFLRTLNHDQMVLLKKYNTGKIFVLPHDQVIWKNEVYSNDLWTYDPWNENSLYESHVNKFISLSNWHKEKLIYFHNIPENMIEVIGNGVNNDIYEKCITEDVNNIDHRILWSSVYKRGGELLINDIAPIVRKYINDFGVDLCSYSYIPTELTEIEYVNLLPRLNKEEYYNEMKKHACYVYPCLVEETYGICPVEAIMCNQDLISTYEHGLEDILSGLRFDKVVDHIPRSGRNDLFDYFINDDDKNEEYWNRINKIAQRIIDSIQNYNNPERIKFRKLAKNYVLERHSWKNIVDKWELIFIKS